MRRQANIIQKRYVISRRCLFDKSEFIVFSNYLFFQDFQTMPTLSMCYKGIEDIFRNVLDFFVNYIYINHIHPKTHCL